MYPKSSISRKEKFLVVVYISLKARIGQEALVHFYYKKLPIKSESVASYIVNRDNFDTKYLKSDLGVIKEGRGNDYSRVYFEAAYVGSQSKEGIKAVKAAAKNLLNQMEALIMSMKKAANLSKVQLK
jgi:hypothetical protein